MKVQSLANLSKKHTEANTVRRYVRVIFIERKKSNTRDIYVKTHFCYFALVLTNIVSVFLF